jgi:hypothetical protein
MDSTWNVSVPAATQYGKGRWIAGENWEIYMQGGTPKVEGLVTKAGERKKDVETGGNAKIAD